MAVLLAIARVPLTRPGRIVLGLLWAAAVVLAERTGYRSLGVMMPLGVVILLTGWAALTNWGGLWDRVAEGEREHHERTGAHPLGQTAVGKAVRGLNRNDDQVSRGLHGAMALLIGPLFIVIGAVAALGLL